ncbi:uncharacterized protein LAESUDRAFT_813885, partial [Laetiporus sulphureus 93-53]
MRNKLNFFNMDDALSDACITAATSSHHAQDEFPERSHFMSRYPVMMPRVCSLYLKELYKSLTGTSSLPHVYLSLPFSIPAYLYAKPFSDMVVASLVLYLTNGKPSLGSDLFIAPRGTHTFFYCGKWRWRGTAGFGCHSEFHICLLLLSVSP